MRKLVGIALTLLILIGCASYNVIPYSDIHYAATNPQYIKVFQYIPPNIKDYTIIAELHGAGSAYTNRNHLLRELKREASEIGGDAIILNYSENYSGNISGSNYYVENGYGYGQSYSEPIYKPSMNGVVLRLNK